MGIHRRASARIVASFLAAGLVSTGLAACNASDGGGGTQDVQVSAEGVDDGTELTLWTRAPLEQQANLLVEAYNATHENQVELTVVPNDDYVAKVGAAAGSGGLPDLFAADIVYVPNWVRQGLFADVTDAIAELEHADEINPSHLAGGTLEGRQHVLPFVLDVSVMFYNRNLYEQAGLDPERGPATLAEFSDHARAVDELGGEVSGTYFGGNCGGCLVFTWFPQIWAGGEDVMNSEGTESLLAGDSAREVYGVWRELVRSGAVGEGSEEETGATWTGPFLEGEVGVMPFPATMLATADEALGEVGVAPIPGPDGGASTFVGGDGIGISKDSEHADQAWNFMSWLMSEEAQVEVLARNGDVVARGDLAENEYSSQDPRVLTVNEVASQGRTPLAINFQQAFNAPGSPWVTMVRNEVFGDGGTLETDNEEITAVLAQ